MQRVQVIGSASTLLLATARIGAHTLTVEDRCSEADGANGPSPMSLVLAGLGASTVFEMQRCAAERCIDLDGVYVEMALHGTMPWQAIGRRIWVTGDLRPQQLSTLLLAAERSVVAAALRPAIDMHTRVSPLPRPDIKLIR